MPEDPSQSLCLQGYFRRTSAVLLGLSIFVGVPASAAELPKGFVYLRAVDPTIQQEMRYFTLRNFVGRRINGYNAGECILTRRAAFALRGAQKKLSKRGLSLKVYDCYRPLRAVRHFVRWARNPRDTLTKREFYPHLDKKNLFRLGYISTRSQHARGSTVDLTIVPAGSSPQTDWKISHQKRCHQPKGRRSPDNSLDFGTGYDCFHPLSHTGNPAIKGKARSNRNLLVRVMSENGFRNYRKEWWHFELRGASNRTYFNFPIVTFLASRKNANIAKAKKDRLSSGIAPSPLSDTRNKGALPMAIEKHLKHNVGWLRLICATADTFLIRQKPTIKSKTVAELPNSRKRLRGDVCRGPQPSLMRWHALNPAAKERTPAPWCRVYPYWPNNKTVVGWINGEKLYAELGSEPECKNK